MRTIILVWEQTGKQGKKQEKLSITKSLPSNSINDVHDTCDDDDDDDCVYILCDEIMAISLNLGDSTQLRYLWQTDDSRGTSRVIGLPEVPKLSRVT